MAFLPTQHIFILWALFIIVLQSYNPTLVKAAPKSSLVTKLPGFNGTFPSKHYSGYVKLNGTKPSKNLFYYFVESERNPGKDPVVLWLNGGPGCSSFDGFVYEHGPFNFEKGKKKGDLPSLHLNPYSWSKVSNIIYLDSPSGVGFSYPLLPTNSSQTATDSHAFLLKWLELFPEFQANPFYLSGESFAGIYVPTLAAEIDNGIRNGAKPKINLKGYMVGNGVTGSDFDGDSSLLSFVHGMAIIPDQLYKEAESCVNISNQEENKCQTTWSKIGSATEELNIYDILEPCYHSQNPEQSNTTSSPMKSFYELGKSNNRAMPVRNRMFGRAWPYRAHVKDGKVPTWQQLHESRLLHGLSVPCFDDEVANTYLNDARVRKAIHASPKAQNWSLCVGLDYYQDLGSMIPFHKNLTAKGYKALIYSGDHDMCVPYTGTERWTASMGYEIVDEWRPWFTDNQVAGFLQGYAHNLTFLTIKVYRKYFLL
ncbi:OLC1v1025742C1 [Oldenlandia corymbosa var. corymbosa]|uniref:OLC1v1025742C1 n=1 Tax=Oldenlandia corymbosa var. corymbosa TaxID=529605 RepID=A0AAV1C5V1_OLDCO|nr:OLC1v1025742C1 [Oldenlandia corymbosa var. corymbosa]